MRSELESALFYRICVQPAFAASWLHLRFLSTVAKFSVQEGVERWRHPAFRVELTAHGEGYGAASIQLLLAANVVDAL